MASNNSFPNTSSNMDISSSSNILIKTIQVFATVIIISGNILTILAVCLFKNMRILSANIMIAFVAVGDLMMGGVYMPMRFLLKGHNELFRERVPCIINIFFSYLSVNCAVFWLSMLSIERFYAVQFPFHYHSHMTATRSFIWCGLTFSIIFLLTLPIICGIDEWVPGAVCISVHILPEYYTSLVITIILLVLIAGFLSFLRVLIAEVNFRFRRRRQEVGSLRIQDSVMSTLMLIVYVLTLTCYIPQLVYVLVIAFRPSSRNQTVLEVISSVGLFSSGINFFVYGIKNSKFRNAFRRMFGCKVPLIGPNS